MTALNVPISRAELENKRSFWVKVAQENGWYEPGPFGIILWVRPDGSVHDSLYQPPQDRHFDLVVVVDEVDDYYENIMVVIELHDDKVVLHAPWPEKGGE